MSIADIMNRRQQQIIEYLTEDNRLCKEHLKGKRMCYTDKQRRRLAAKAKVLGRKILRQLNPLVTPDTQLVWCRLLVAQKYDGSSKRGAGRPRVMREIEDLIVEMAQSNSGWGAFESKELNHLGHAVSRTTIANILGDTALNQPRVKDDRQGVP